MRQLPHVWDAACTPLYTLHDLSSHSARAEHHFYAELASDHLRKAPPACHRLRPAVPFRISTSNPPPLQAWRASVNHRLDSRQDQRDNNKHHRQARSLLYLVSARRLVNQGQQSGNGRERARQRRTSRRRRIVDIASSRNGSDSNKLHLTRHKPVRRCTCINL